MLKIVSSFWFSERRVSHCQKIPVVFERSPSHLPDDVKLLLTKSNRGYLGFAEAASHKVYLQSPHLSLLYPCPLKLQQEESALLLHPQLHATAGGEEEGRALAALLVAWEEQSHFPTEKVEVFSQNFETICRAGMWPSDQPLYYLSMWSCECGCNTAVQHSCPVTSPSTQGGCSVGTDLSFSRQFHFPSLSVSPAHFSICIWSLYLIF